MESPTPAGAPITRRVGWLHFLNDFTLDFLTPLLPAGVGAAWIGVMEGTADAVGQVLKLFTGRASDRTGRRVPWVAAGYGTNAIARVLAGVGMLLALPWWIVGCRIIDRVGKGVRGSATDALVTDWTGDDERARTFARMRVMDHLGATLGGLAATVVALMVAPALLGWAVMALAPIALTVLWLCRGLRDAPAPTIKAVPVGWWPRAPALRRPLIAVLVAGIAVRLSPLLVLVQVAGLPEGGEGAWPLWQVCLGWAVLGLVQAGAAEISGRFTERLGPAAFLRFAWLAGAAVFIAIALTDGPWLIAAGLAFGAVAGLGEGAEKTWIAALAPREERALAFGALALVTALATMAGNGLVGLLLANHATTVFLLLAGIAVVGSLLSLGSTRPLRS